MYKYKDIHTYVFYVYEFPSASFSTSGTIAYFSTLYINAGISYILAMKIIVSTTVELFFSINYNPLGAERVLERKLF